MSSMVQRYDMNGNEEDEVQNGIRLFSLLKKAFCICRRTSHGMDRMFSIYAMTAVPRGVALILNFEEFDDEEKFKKRNGSKCDVKRLWMLFKKFLFEVEIYSNLTRKEFESRLKSFSIDSRHETANMMILALLSHGDTGVIYTSDGSPVLVESIVEMFNNRNCLLLKGKPKWFIVQACRGDLIDRGCQTDQRPSSEDYNSCYADANPFQAPIRSKISVQTQDSIETSQSVEDGVIYTSDGSPVSMESIVEMFNNQNCHLLKGKPKWFIVQACRGDLIDRGCQTDQRPSSEDSNSCYADANPFQAPIRSKISVQTQDSIETSPSVEDVLISWATIPGHISVRHPEDGSWFIQCLVKIFNKYAGEHDLFELLQLTSKELSKQFCPEVGKQACNIDVRNFYNKLYF